MSKGVGRSKEVERSKGVRKSKGVCYLLEVPPRVHPPSMPLASVARSFD